MATLADLWHAVFPSAHRLGRLDAERWAVEVVWVRVLKARVPAFDVLEPGDLAIIPASGLALVAPTPSELDGLVDALARAGVAGAVLVGSAERALDVALGAALARAGVPALRLDQADPIQLERSVIGFLVNRRAELERQAAALEYQLQQLALLGRGLDVLASAVGAFMGRAVVVENRHGDPLVIRLPSEQPAAAAATVARYHADPEAVSLRLPLPTGEGTANASLVLLGAEPIRERERVAAERIAPLLALEISRSMGILGTQPPGRTESLPASGPPWAVLVARQIVEGPDVPTDVTLAEREVTRGEIRLLAPPGRLVLRGDAESLELRAVVAATPDDPDGLELAARIAAHLGRPVAVSHRFVEPTGRQVAEAEARATLETIERLVDPPPVARSSRLPAYRILASLPDVPDGLRQARALLEPLLVGRPALQRQRLATLRAVVDREAHAEAASALGVHRNTIAYRVRRIEELGGWDLADPDLRLALAVAIRIVQRAQAGVSEA